MTYSVKKYIGILQLYIFQESNLFRANEMIVEWGGGEDTQQGVLHEGVDLRGVFLGGTWRGARSGARQSAASTSIPTLPNLDPAAPTGPSPGPAAWLHRHTVSIALIWVTLAKRWGEIVRDCTLACVLSLRAGYSNNVFCRVIKTSSRNIS